MKHKFDKGNGGCCANCKRDKSNCGSCRQNHYHRVHRERHATTERRKGVRP